MQGRVLNVELVEDQPVVTEVNFIVSLKVSTPNYGSLSLSCGETVAIPKGRDPMEILDAEVSKVHAYVNGKLKQLK